MLSAMTTGPDTFRTYLGSKASKHAEQQSPQASKEGLLSNKARRPLCCCANKVEQKPYQRDRKGRRQGNPCGALL